MTTRGGRQSDRIGVINFRCRAACRADVRATPCREVRRDGDVLRARGCGVIGRASKTEGKRDRDLFSRELAKSRTAKFDWSCCCGDGNINFRNVRTSPHAVLIAVAIKITRYRWRLTSSAAPIISRGQQLSHRSRNHLV